jgi:hypothetical protein
MDVFIGKNFDVIEKDTLNSLFSLEKSIDKGLYSIIETRKRLREIGHLLALDIFCNNWDRLPVIWNNDGSTG